MIFGASYWEEKELVSHWICYCVLDMMGGEKAATVLNADMHVDRFSALQKYSFPLRGKIVKQTENYKYFQNFLQIKI